MTPASIGSSRSASSHRLIWLNWAALYSTDTGAQPRLASSARKPAAYGASGPRIRPDRRCLIAASFSFGISDPTRAGEDRGGLLLDRAVRRGAVGRGAAARAPAG